MAWLRSFLSSLSILSVCLLSADGQTGGADRIKVMFTPTICQVRCSQERCRNYCERGNVTTLYSGGQAPGGAPSPSFRVCKCAREALRRSRRAPELAHQVAPHLAGSGLQRAPTCWSVQHTG